MPGAMTWDGVIRVTVALGAYQKTASSGGDGIPSWSGTEINKAPVYNTGALFIAGGLLNRGGRLGGA